VQKNNRQTGVSTQAQAVLAEDHFHEDFHLGITGPMQILRHIPAHDQFTTLLGDWPNALPADPAPSSDCEN
jgi:hypothetical protein